MQGVDPSQLFGRLSANGQVFLLNPSGVVFGVNGAAHLRYPEDLFKVQRVVMSRYHVTDPATFYNGTDFWIVPFDPTQSIQQFQPPYYLTLQMPGQEQPTFSLTTTFAPQRRPTLAAFMAVDSAPGDGYGTIRVLQLPSNTTIRLSAIRASERVRHAYMGTAVDTDLPVLEVEA